jgi:hypothetical protein
MSNPHIDLDLWLDKSIVDRQKHLKAQCIEILEGIGNSLTNDDLRLTHPTSRGKKISKGSDLLGYPYLVLDLIRDFNPETGLNIRVLNWFGHGLFIMVFLGKETDIFSDSLLANGFEFGLTDKPWDFGKLILMRSTTRDRRDIQNHKERFRIWIKKINHVSEINLLTNEILKEVKDVIHLRLTSSLK